MEAEGLAFAGLAIDISLEGDAAFRKQFPEMDLQNQYQELDDWIVYGSEECNPEFQYISKEESQSFVENWLSAEQELIDQGYKDRY